MCADLNMVKCANGSWEGCTLIGRWKRYQKLAKIEVLSDEQFLPETQHTELNRKLHRFVHKGIIVIRKVLDN